VASKALAPKDDVGGLHSIHPVKNARVNQMSFLNCKIKKIEKNLGALNFELSHAFCTVTPSSSLHLHRSRLITNGFQNIDSTRDPRARPKIFPIGDATVRRCFYLRNKLYKNIQVGDDSGPFRGR
jgi:hypothetical protein